MANNEKTKRNKKKKKKRRWKKRGTSLAVARKKMQSRNKMGDRGRGREGGVRERIEGDRIKMKLNKRVQFSKWEFPI